jgi:hypothetical protein
VRPTEAVQLVGIIRALCPGQKLEDLTPDAWQLVLDDVSYTDAQAAVRTVYRRLADDEQWKGYARIEAKDVLAECRRMWRQRLAHVPEDALIPPPDLTPREELEWRRAAMRAIANGAPVPDNTRGELKPRDLRQLGAGGHTCTCKPVRDESGVVVHAPFCDRHRTVADRTNTD